MLLNHRIQEYKIINFPDSIGIKPEHAGDKLIIEGEEYSPQSRTLLFLNTRTNEKSKKFVKFPTTHFCKYSFGIEGHKQFLYTLTGWEDGKPVYLYLPDVNNIMGMVGLGDYTAGSYISNVDLDLSEFINIFWFSPFNSKAIEMYDLDNLMVHKHKLSLKLPHLWAKEIPFGFELWQKE